MGARQIREDSRENIRTPGNVSEASSAQCKISRAGRAQCSVSDTSNARSSVTKAGSVPCSVSVSKARQVREDSRENSGELRRRPALTLVSAAESQQKRQHLLLPRSAKQWAQEQKWRQTRQ